MKKYINQKEVFELDINITFVQSDIDIAATDIKPIIIDKDKQILDDSAQSDFNVFVQNLFATLTYYDFEILDDYKHTSKSFPRTSEYCWVAHRTELDADSVPKYINLRISDHFQNFSKARDRQLAKQRQAEANSIKRPSTKKKQKFEVEEIVVNNQTYFTYEDALADAERLIFKWLESRGVDMSEYDMLGW